MRLFADYSPKRRRNFLWCVFTVIIVLLAITIVFLFGSIFKSNSILIKISGLVLVLLIIFTYILGLIISHWQYYAEATKNDFTNNVVHEIKTPITVISLACEMLQDNEVMSKDDSQEQIKTYIPIIATETDRLKKMVDVFLQHSRIESSHFPLSFEQIDLHELIQKLTLRARILVERKNGKLNLELNAQNSMITGDVLQLTNVFTNIVDNAVKYSNGAPFITVKTESKLLGIVVRISDNGIGISEKELPHIFEKFYRV
ncbi:MAG: hypothetical protein IK032_02255, partial [Bacteroidales bacterium]|nr:hypothetical protein [Bacteroidales bacterium]